jgi:putative PIN family toxin of toxin-antitoxin system
MKHVSGGVQLRAVVDTNVYISAFLYPDRPISQVVLQAAQRRYRLLISPAILREVGKVMREDLGWEERVRIRHLKTLTKAAEMIFPATTLDVIAEDPADNRILECAVDGRAELIVSGDQHLRRLKSYEGIPIVRPIDFLRTLGVANK